MQTRTWDSLLSLTKGLCGTSSFESTEETMVGNFLNRRLYFAYKRTDYWPRYIVLGEARTASANVIPFTQSTLNTIDTFLRIYDASPYDTDSVTEYEFNVISTGAKVAGNSSDATTFYVDYKKIWTGPFNATTNTSVPEEHYEYAAHGAYADFLRWDKQTDKAAVADAEAEQILMLELANPMMQRTSNLAGKRIRTHGSYQSR